MELLDPRNDFIFKRIFGSESNKDVLLAFLNSTFVEAGEPPLTEIILMNPYTEKDATHDKQSILDIKAKTTEGKLINIEMQLFNPYNMEKRTLFYWSQMYSHQIKEGGNYGELKKCVTINILNYSCLPNERYHNVFHLREDHSLIPLIDDIEIHVMELPKLNQYEVPSKGGLVNWLLFLKGIDKTKWEVLTMNEPMLKKAMTTLEFLSQDEQTRMEYEARQKYLLDEASRVAGAKAEGIAEGMAKGMAKGKVEVARKLLALGVEIALIAKASGLSEEEIKKLSPLH
ncbi:Rpn family recombination-promoting nuclease/putative transposase [Paenibacillus dendritiformis]|uniref:Rpn family recombination-promoting nuclease/putative transposase n=1 Tax=Paenibacillus dendritiformis TaxID=130049 RepID=UPI0010597656|nr:Rpn family recombination-promoting nuclease/putative transposase [Paenibacillus dendritiformis]TDL48811.1 Rpn family recombination-promoting nuclease/putative transposase [Paenibacillus dendritiformis]